MMSLLPGSSHLKKWRESMKIDLDKVRIAARRSVPVTIKSFTLPHDLEMDLEKVLEVFLEEIGQEGIKDPVFYCFRELAVNAKKANTKRVYFIDRSLDLQDPEHYKKGMDSFKEDTLSNIDYYLKRQTEEGLYIKVRFELRGGVLYITVANNTEITRKELMRVYDRIARARAFSTMEEAFSLVLDDSEGAGLGIVIMILILRKIGLDEENFDIDVEDGETVARLIIPTAKVRADHLNKVTDMLAGQIETIPQFPENVAVLQSRLNDPNVEITEIARSIANDFAMTADLLKLVNSAAFMLPKRVDNIPEAVKLVGLRALKNLLYSYGTQKILGEETPETRGLWEHSFKTAFYSYTLAKSMLRRKDLLDDAYIGGILHDIGKLVLSHAHPDLLQRIRAFAVDRGLSAVRFEDFSAGMNHAEVGARIAEKWNFPEVLISAIRYHHEPGSAPRQHRDTVYLVYLANFLAYDDEAYASLEDFDPEVLSFFSIGDVEQLRQIGTKLGEAYKIEREKMQA